MNRETTGLSTPDRHRGVTAPKGFQAAGVAAGIKESGALDLALVVNEGPGQAAAGVFTTNQVKAAPVLWSQQVLKERKLHAVVLNSGGANGNVSTGSTQKKNERPKSKPCQIFDAA